MSIEFNPVNYETDYSNTFQTEATNRHDSNFAISYAEKKRDINDTEAVDPAAQTGNTGPAGSVSPADKHPDSIEDYLLYLQEAFPDSIFSVGEYDFDSLTAGLPQGLGSIVLSPELLQRMIDDPGFGRQMEQSIKQISEADKILANQFDVNGGIIAANGSIFKEDGSYKSWQLMVNNFNRELEEIESTEEFMELEDLRERAMSLNLESHDDIQRQIEKRDEQKIELQKELERRIEEKKELEKEALEKGEDSDIELHFSPLV